MNKRYNIEAGFISKLLETKDIITIKDSQIKKSYFTGDNKNAYSFILDSLKNNGEIPTVRVFKKRFPNYPLEEYINESGKKVTGTEESLTFWCQELRKKTKHNTIVETVEEVGELLENFDADGACNLLRKRLLYIETEVNKNVDVDVTKDIEDRKEAYLKKKRTGGMIGYSTGFNKLDYLTKGLKNETLTTIIAKTGVGKTFLLVLIACHLVLDGHKVIVGVTEMSEDLMRDRFEALLFAMTSDCDFSYNDFKSGRLNKEIEEEFFTFLDEVLPSLTSLVIFTAVSPLTVEAEIQKYDPDVILIDGAYLMEDDQQARDDWLRVAHITRDLKKLAKKVKKPIVINTQANKNTGKKVSPDVEDIMYTQAIGQDSDDIFALYRDNVMENDKEMTIAIKKQREGGLGKVVLNWDFQTMTFNEIYSEEDKGDDVDEDSYIDEDNV